MNNIICFFLQISNIHLMMENSKKFIQTNVFNLMKLIKLGQKVIKKF